MSNRDDWENVANEISGLGHDRLVAELHNAFVAGQEQERNAVIDALEEALLGVEHEVIVGESLDDVREAVVGIVERALGKPPREPKGRRR